MSEIPSNSRVVLYTASIVLIPAQRFAALRGNMLPSTLTHTWQQALIAMESLSKFCPSAKRCLTSLQMLSQEIIGQAGVSQESVHQSDEAMMTTWQEPMASTAFPEEAFDEMPSDYTWIDSLPVDLLADDDFMGKYLET